MDRRNTSSSTGSEYLDIVNEINDFIASLDAPPLDNHTNKLVGNASSSQRKKTFGNHGDDDEPPESWEGLRSRNRSGEGGSDVEAPDVLLTSDGKLSDVDADTTGIYDSAVGYDAAQDDNYTAPFPVTLLAHEDVDPFATYDYVGGPELNSSQSTTTDYGEGSSDYSNTSSGGSYSVYSDGSSSSSCEAADSDSGCYSRLPAAGAAGMGSASRGLDGCSSPVGSPGHQLLPSGSFTHQQPHLPYHSDTSGSADQRGQDCADQNHLVLGSSAHSFSSPSSSYSSPPPLPSSSSPSPSSSSSSPIARAAVPGGFHHNHPHNPQYSDSHFFQEYRGPLQGQYSAPTSPAVHRKVSNQVISGIKTGRSLDDSHNHPPNNCSKPIRPEHPFYSTIQENKTTQHKTHQTPPPQQVRVGDRCWPPAQSQIYQTPTSSSTATTTASTSTYTTTTSQSSQSHIPSHESPQQQEQQQQHQHYPHSFQKPLQQQNPQLKHVFNQKDNSIRNDPGVITQQHSTSVHDRPGHPVATKPTSSEPANVSSGHYNTPPPKVPNLSVLISELRSVSPCSESSPTSTYTDFARSESVSSSSSASSPAPSRASESDPSSSTSSVEIPEVLGLYCHYQTPPAAPSPTAISYDKASIQSGHVKQVASPAPSSSASSNEGVRCSLSPEHDYEPIENIQLEIPTSPRPETKFPHPRGQKKMADGGTQPKHVKALHNFKGSNNDELCFKRGDIITVTQCVEGGWWEGTLNGRTGWFPSNYVKEVRADISLKSNKSGDVPVYKRESMQLYHNVVLKNVIETEKTHVSEMIKVLQSYIKPIEGANLLSGPEYNLLVGNLEEVIAFQQSFLAALEECEKLPSGQRRIGGVFMQFAADMKDFYSLYCANHPNSVSVLQSRREELSKFVESQGAPCPGAQTLTTILSKPFTRLDKYPSLLKELERHVEESHPDRGDTQRAIAVYRNIANTCSEIRKMKEMEHEIITSTIQGWEGEEISKLGEILRLSQVKLLTQTGEKFDRIFLLFQSCLVMLSMSSRLSSYQYEGNIPLSGLSTTSVDGDCFEITGPMIEKITVSCGSKTEANTWMELLNQLVSSSGHPASSAKPQPLQVHMISTCQPSVSTVTSAKTAQISSTTAPPPSGPASAPNSNPAPAPPSSQNPLASKTSCVWSLTCLRPSPPLRPSLMCRDEVLKSPRAVRKSTQKRKPVRTVSGEESDWHSKNDPKVYNEDAFILQVIEAYCNSVKTRHTVNSCRIETTEKKKSAVEVIGKGKEFLVYDNASRRLEDASAILNSPQILLAEEEKIFDETEQQERTVVDTVYALQDRVKELEQEQRKLRIDLDEERRCRRKLEMLVRGQVIKSGIIDVGGGGDTNAT